MTQLAQPSPETAPRDLVQLEKMGRFQLRKLAETLGIVVNNSEDPEQKQKLVSFMGQSTTEQASTVLTQLKALDAGGGAAPVQTPEQNGAPANGTAPAGLRRTPVEKPTGPATATSMPSSSAPVDLSPVMNILAQVLKGQENILSNQKDVYGQLAELKAILGVTTATNLIVGETACNTSRQDVLDQALADTQAVLDQIGETIKGKGKKK